MTELKQLGTIIAMLIITFVSVIVIFYTPHNDAMVGTPIMTAEVKDLGITNEITVNCSDGVCYDPKTGYELGNLPGDIILSSPVFETKKETP